jgi:hypothetical protein
MNAGAIEMIHDGAGSACSVTGHDTGSLLHNEDVRRFYAYP